MVLLARIFWILRTFSAKARLQEFFNITKGYQKDFSVNGKKFYRAHSKICYKISSFPKVSAIWSSLFMDRYSIDTNEPLHEETGFLHMQKQRCRSAFSQQGSNNGCHRHCFLTVLKQYKNKSHVNEICTFLLV